MNDKTDNKTIDEKAQETANKLFGEKPKDVEEALKQETTLGSPNNLFSRDEDEEEE